MTKNTRVTNLSDKNLQILGLNDNEIVLYTKLISTGSITVLELSKLLSFPRTLIYHLLNSLISKGLVSFQKNKAKAIYFANDPEVIYDLLEKQQKEFQSNVFSLREVVPNLRNSFLAQGQVPKIKTFAGLDEFSNILEDVLNCQEKVLYIYENLSLKKKALEIRKTFNNRRVLRKVKSDIVFCENKESLENLKNIKYNDFTNWFGVEAWVFPSISSDIYIYDNKVLYINYPEKGEVVGFLIEEKNFSTTQKYLFKNLLQNAKNRTLYYTIK